MGGILARVGVGWMLGTLKSIDGALDVAFIEQNNNKLKSNFISNHDNDSACT
jgi:hypothetical protein